MVMKIPVFIRCLIVYSAFLCSISYSQISKASTNDPNKVNLFESYQSDQAFYKRLQSMSLDELKHFSKIIYESDEKDPLAIDRELERHPKLKASPAVLQKMYLQKVKDRLSVSDYILLRVPCLIKADIIAIKSFQDKVDGGVPGAELKFPKTEITAVVENVIKGNSIFSARDTIVFYYYQFWRPTLSGFMEGETCLVPIQPLIFKGKVMFSLVTDLEGKVSDSIDLNDNKSYGRYPIVNDSLIDKDNFFGFGKKVDINTFEQYLKNKIKEIKSW